MPQAVTRSLPRAALRLFLCALSLAALAARIPAPAAAEPSLLAPDGGVWALAFAALWLLYGRRLAKPRAQVRLWLLAALFAAATTFSQSYAAVGNASLITGDPWRAALYFAGRVPLYCAGMALLQSALLAPCGGADRPAPAKAPKSPARSAVRFGLLLFLCWLPYLYFIFPGTVSSDSVSQVMEIIGLEKMSNANPLFQTALVYLVRGLGAALGSANAAVALYCGLQAALMAWLLGDLVSRIGQSEAPRWLFGVSFAFYAFCPVFPLFAFCLGKDTNFSMAVLWLSLAAYRQVESAASPATARPNRADRVQTVRLCLAGALCTLLRNPGVYLALLTLLSLLGWALFRRRARPRLWRAPACATVSVLAVYGLLHLVLLPNLAIAPMPETENWSVPLQQVARVAATFPLTDEEAAAVDAVVELDRLPAAYRGELSDPVKLLWRGSVSDAQKAAFFRVWRGLLRKYPATCLSATFHNVYGYLTPGYTSRLKATLLIGSQRSLTPPVRAAFNYAVNPRADALKAFTDRLSQNPLYRALIAPGLYGWLTLFAAATLARRKGNRLLIAALPAAFSLVGCLFSAVNGYFRYAMPLYLCAPLLLWLCAQSRAAYAPLCGQRPARKERKPW